MSLTCLILAKRRSLHSLQGGTNKNMGIKLPTIEPEAAPAQLYNARETRSLVLPEPSGRPLMGNEGDQLEPDERITVLRAQSGERDAFDKLVDLYQERLMYYVRRLAPD